LARNHFSKALVPILVSVSAVLGGCGFLPAQGPFGPGVVEQAAAVAPVENPGATAIPYLLVQVDERVVRLAATDIPNPRFAGSLTDRRPPRQLTIGAGDVISLSVFEAAPGGLFTPAVSAGARPGNFVDIPAQTVGQTGTINVPFAGTVQVAGRTPGEIERDIESRLRNRAIEPQVVLTLREQRANQASVLGEVNAATKVTLNPQGERVLDLIARAGGPRFPAYESVVSIQRGGRKAQVSLASLIRDPSNNIFVAPGDTIYVAREQRYYVALGAAGQNGLFHFDSDSVTLAYAMGKAGGLLDERADPTSVFVYRLLPRRQAEKYHADISHIHGDVIPTVFAINLRDPSGLFLTQAWQMRDRDVIFVSNATSVEIAKMLQFVRIGINTVREGQAIR
jgi:polysaccharide export outer membrane protein